MCVIVAQVVDNARSAIPHHNNVLAASNIIISSPSSSSHQLIVSLALSDFYNLFNTLLNGKVWAWSIFLVVCVNNDNDSITIMIMIIDRDDDCLDYECRLVVLILLDYFTTEPYFVDLYPCVLYIVWVSSTTYYIKLDHKRTKNCCGRQKSFSFRRRKNYSDSRLLSFCIHSLHFHT